MQTSTLVGCIPVVGTAVGAWRIYDAVREADQRVSECLAETRTEGLSKIGGTEKILHGACELIPIIGPIIYGIGKLAVFVAHQVNNLYNSIFSCSKGAHSSKMAGPVDLTDSLGKENDPIGTLRENIGKEVKLYVPRYAAATNNQFTEEDENKRIYNSNYVRYVEGKLTGVSEETFGRKERYKIDIEYEEYNETFTQTFYISTSELINGNHPDYRIVL